MSFELNKDDWKFRKWFPRPALIEKSGSRSLYVGQRFDPKYFELVENGWTHDHCEICAKTITDFKTADSEDCGYFYNGDWICESCFKMIE
jgi:predicted nucleic acid-binding Zn ribbon protein